MRQPEPDVPFEQATPASNGNGQIDSVSGSASVAPDLKRFQRHKPTHVDRLPPHSREAEQGVLGCVLLSPNDCLGRCIEKLKSGAEVFYDLRHQTIYSAVVEMYDKREPIDIITLQQQLSDKQLLDQIGGIPYLNALQDSVPSAANLTYYLDIVHEKSVLRRIVKTCTEVVGRVYDYQGTVDELVDSVGRDIEKVIELQQQNGISPILDGKQAGARMEEDLDRRWKLQGKLSGMDTGLVDLNYMLEGVQFGEQFVVGARPSQGKTALGLSLFKHMAFNGIPSLFISLEMSVEAVMRRLLSMHMNVTLREIRRGTYNEGQVQKFILFQSECARHPMHIVDGVGGIGVRELCSIVRRKVIQHGIKFVVIDYLQKIKPAERHEKRTYEIGDISGRLKSLAVECNIGLLTLAQLNRENTKEKGRPPRLSDLADSGQIERDADTVGLLHKTPDKTMLIIAKQRDGETGIINLVFDGSYVRFENYTPERE